MAEQLALIEVPPQPPEWDEMEVFYSLPQYVRPLVDYLRAVGFELHGRCGPRTRSACKLALSPAHVLVEPCVGGGALITGMQAYVSRTASLILTGDVRDVGADWLGDWAGDASQWRQNRCVAHRIKDARFVVSNPPFSRAKALVEASWVRCPRAMVAMLLPARWYSPTKERGPWLRKHNPDRINIGRCEFFRPDGSSAGDGDSTDYEWMLWGPDRRGPLGGHHEIRPWKEAG